MGVSLLFAGHEAELWEIEQRQLHERHQLARTQLKETFFLQRSQMLNRHQKVSYRSDIKSLSKVVRCLRVL